MAQVRKRRTAAKPRVEETDTAASSAASVSPPEDLAARCFVIAEALNERAELALAVPFYRQAVTLLLAQRAHNTSAEHATVALLQAVDPAGDSTPACAAMASAALPSDLQEHIRALGEDLTADNAATVRQVLQALLDELPLPDAQLLALVAKTYLLDGQLDAALQHFRAALQLDPNDQRLIVNTGGALLACGEPREAVKLMRPLMRQAASIDDPPVLRALIGNLAAAELEAGHVAEAARLRADLAGLSPDGVPLDDWLDDARAWIAAGAREETRGLLIALRALYPRHADLLQLLAETLEACGDYRDAALVYRDLLRPTLGAS